MGAEFSIASTNITDDREAWASVVNNALYDYGHRGYTGSFAEKHDYVVLDCEAESFEQAEQWAYDIDDECINHSLPESRRHPVHRQYASDKWGPAGAIPVKGGGFVFFGWCSS